MCSNPTGPYAIWQETGHYLLPAYSHPNEPFNLTWSHYRGLHEAAGHIEYHHYYGLNPWFPYSPSWRYPWQHTWPATVSMIPAPAPPPPPPQTELSWPEGATLRLQLQWGRPRRVYGPHRALPDFVREDLRRVYGTYPRTDVSITYRGGEYVVRGDPHVGDQEYRVEKKVVRRLESPQDDGVSETVEGKKKKKK